MVIYGIHGAPSVNDLADANTTAVGSLSQNPVLLSPRMTTSSDGALEPATVVTEAAQETLQPQVLNFSNFSNFSPSGTLADGAAALALPADNLNDGDTTRSDVPAVTSSLNAEIRASSTPISAGIAKSVQSLPNVPKSISTTLQPSSNMDRSNLPTPNTRTVLAPGVSTTLQYPGTDPQPDLTSGTKTSTAISNFKYISPSSHTVSDDFTATRGSDTSTSGQSLPDFRTGVLDDFGTPILLLSHTTALPSNRVKEPPPLTISGHTVTADSLGQYVINNQTLTRGGVVTVSGTKISLAANASDVIVGTSTEALGPSVTAELASGPNGTEIQKFSGNALGARDGVTSSSILWLVSKFLVLLWM